MCGISGIVTNSKTKKVIKHNLKQDIQKMTDTMIHRGPDDFGYYIDKNIALGHRRLSIVDLSAAGHQPMLYDNNNLVIVFNGEIYNYLEIKEELKTKGYKFKTHTDTEVILASYCEWGIDCQERFNGMWAFVIYDKKNNLLFGSRDRLGVKPLYYYKSSNLFLFSSEIKAILAYKNVKAKANDKIVWEFLVTGSVDYSEETMFSDIFELRGGHYFIYKNNKLKIIKYWDLKNVPDNNNLTDREYQDRFKELFLDSVKLRLRSDVPIGSCLSGGLDSSAIVCAINGLLKEDDGNDQVGKWQKTFSACYDSEKYPGCDERKFIEEVTKKTKTKAHYVFPEGGELAQEIKKMVWYHDIPFCGTSIYAQWNVFQQASKNKIKVMLDGQGADELLAGYHTFYSRNLLDHLYSGNIFQFFSETNHYIKNHHRALPIVILEMIFSTKISKKLENLLPIKIFHKEYQVFNKNWFKKYKYNIAQSINTNSLKTFSYNQIKILRLPALLRYEDRDSMAFSIESRVPFLDYRLVEFIYSLRNNQKIRHGETKWIMRKALKGILPEKIRNRQDKVGFATPEQIWMKENFKEEFKKVFSSNSFKSRGYFNQTKVLENFENYLTGRHNNYNLFWRMYNLEIWFQTFID